MAQLRQDYDQFVRHDTEVLVAGPEGARTFARVWEEQNHPFIGLPDPRRKVLKLFKQKVNLWKLGRMPAQVIIDKQGIVRFGHYGKSMSDIPSTETLFEYLEGFAAGDRAGSPQPDP
jgi:peroxiredoxin